MSIPFRPKDPARDHESPSIIWVIAACRFSEAIAVGMLVPILPLFLEKLDSDLPNAVDRLFSTSERLSLEQQTAILFSLTGFAMAFIQIASGRVSDRYDLRKPLILLGMTGGAICSASFLMIETYPGLLVSRVLQGICMGITFPPLMAIIARHAPEGQGGQALGVYSTIRLLGFAGGPLLGGWIAEVASKSESAGPQGGYPAVFLTSAVLLALSIFTVSLWVPEHKEGRVHRTSQAAGPMIPVSFDSRILGAAIFLMMVGISAMISLFPTYRSQFDATERELGLVFSIFILTRFLLQYPLGVFGDRWDKKWLLIGAMVLLVPTVCLQGFVSSLSELLLLRVVLGVSAAAMSISINGIAADRSVAGNRARTMGINTFSFSLGVACGPLLTGFITDPRIAFAVPAAGSALLIAVISIRVPSDRKFQRAIKSPVKAAAP